MMAAGKKRTSGMLLNESSKFTIQYINGIIDLLEKPTTNAQSQISNCFRDEVFFLCLQKRSINEKLLKDDIELLGGKLESFFSQEVTCIVTDETVVKDSSVDEATNADINLKTSKSVCESSSKEVTSSGACNSLFTKARTRNMLMAMPKGRKTTPKNSTLNMFANAKLWGQAIWKIDAFQNFLKQAVNYVKRQTKVKSKLKSSSHKNRILNEKSKVVFLQKFFIKVENSKRNKYPIYKNLPYYPSLEINPTTRNGSPFNDNIVKKNLISHKNNQLTRNSTELSSNTFPINKKLINNVSKKKKSLGKHRYYCQCCNTNFSSYERHTKGPRHQAYIKKKENFQCIFDVLKEYGIKSTLEEVSKRDGLGESSDFNSTSDESIPFLSNETLKKPCRINSSLSSDMCIPPLDNFLSSNLKHVQTNDNFTKTNGTNCPSDNEKKDSPLRDMPVLQPFDISHIESERKLQGNNIKHFKTNDNFNDFIKTNGTTSSSENEKEDSPIHDKPVLLPFVISHIESEQKHQVGNNGYPEENHSKASECMKLNHFSTMDQENNPKASECAKLNHFSTMENINLEVSERSATAEDGKIIHEVHSLAFGIESAPLYSQNKVQMGTSNDALKFQTLETESVNFNQQKLGDILNISQCSSNQELVPYQCKPRSVFIVSSAPSENMRKPNMDCFNSESSDDFELRQNVIEAMNIVVETNEYDNENPLDLTPYCQSKFN